MDRRSKGENDTSTAALVSGNSVWVANTADSTVMRVDALTNGVVATIAVHAAPRFLADGEGSIWVFCQSDGSVVRIDPATNRVAAFMQSNPNVFYITDHYRDYPWVLVRFSAVDVRALPDLIERAWRLVAPKSMVAKYDAHHG